MHGSPTKDLVWDQSKGVGYYPVDPAEWPYDQNYFDQFKGYEGSPIARGLNTFRLLLAMTYGPGLPLLDFGIGSGTFIEELMRQDVCEVYGHDVNPAAKRWLADRKIERPWTEAFERMTFWDSLEHIENPDTVLAKCLQFAFVSMPIYRDEAHVRGSKHFKPREHYWYYTDVGFRRYMARQGFELRYHSDFEVIIGREDIGTYVWQRIRPPPSS